MPKLLTATNVFFKLAGDIFPQGESYADEIRLARIPEYDAAAFDILTALIDAARLRNRPEASIKWIADSCHESICGLHSLLSDYLKEASDEKS